MMRKFLSADYKFKPKQATDTKETIRLLNQMCEYGLCDDNVKNLLMREIQTNDQDPISFSLQSGLIPLAKIEHFLSTQFMIQSIDLSTVCIDDEVLRLAPPEEMIRHDMMPFNITNNVLSVVMNQPYLHEKLNTAEKLFAGDWAVEPFFCKNMSVREAIDLQFAHASQVEPLITQLSSVVADKTDNQIVSPDHIIIKLVEGLLLEGLEERASDIHFDSNAYFVTQRLRIDGVLVEKRKLNVDLWGSIKIRLKVLSNIDITENQLPQDGSFFIRLKNRDYDFRLSSLPSIHGESIVLRLNSHKSVVELEALGFGEKLNRTLKNLVKQPSGLILIGGPTGSGKTTTLYALLQTLNLNIINVATLEDPVEHIMPQIRQTNVRPELGLDFAQGIRSLLRQDPDILLIGEIRDKESAELAIKASLTGHLVLATVHAAYIKDIPNRMLGLLDNESALYSQTLAIMAQRLLRKLCFQCQGSGCQNCNQSGYYGRFAIMEYLIFDDKKLTHEMTNHHYQTLATIADEAIDKGLTDKAEIERVMGENLTT